jgi:alanyl-tRNA synthetase
LSAEDLRLVEDDVNRWIVESHPVRAISTSLDEAKRLGAMALFNEKYGEVVRMVEVGDGDLFPPSGGGRRLVSRELCGGTHVHNTAEVGVFRIVTETSSAANVRRIEAITGPEAIDLFRERDRELSAVAETLRVPTGRVVDSVQKLSERVRELERAARRGGAGNGAADVDKLIAAATQSDGASILAEVVEVSDGQALLELADRLKGKLGDAVIVLVTAGEGRVDLVASVAPALVARGVRAGEIIKLAAAEVGGGGGGRDTMARAGGKDPAQLPAAINAARTAIEAALHA